MTTTTPVRQALLSVSDKPGLVDFARALAARHDAMLRPPDRDEADRGPLHLRDRRGDRLARDRRGVAVERDVHARPRHLHHVSHAASGTSSQTVSTWAVCGNMS